MSMKKHVSQLPMLNFRLQRTALNQQITPNISKAATIIADMEMGAMNGSSAVEVGTRIVTDIYDTVKSSGDVKLFGIPLGGIDVSQLHALDPNSLSNGICMHVSAIN